MISRVKGTQDFLDLSIYNSVIERIKKQLQSYHFTEIATPLLEYIELFKRSLGEHTDVITKEMFLIAPHEEHEEETLCLRPEGTASVVRAYLENGIQSKPWKVFSYGPMFRYERPQKGRYRQFHQVTMEVLGSAAIEQDVQLIKMLDRFFHEQLSLNSYALLINFLGCLADRQEYKEKLRIFLDKHQGALCNNCQIRKEKNILRIFDCKIASCQEMYTQAPYLTDHLCSACAVTWQALQDQLTLLSISYAHAPTLVRGLDYYNNTVFEFVSDHLGAQRAFCGGGRYDALAQQLGAKELLPAVGAAIGIERLLMLIEHAQTLQLPVQPALYVVMPLAQEQRMLALLLADMLQANELCVEIALDNDSLKSMMRYANRLGAKYALILGEEEQKTHTVTMKNMITGEQERIPQTAVVDYINR